MSRAALLSLALPALARAGCPFGGQGAPPAGHPVVGRDRALRFAAAVESVDFDAVAADVREALTDSKDLWPADFGNYGPLLVRLAWHCSGSYRLSDGRGGCDGGRIRFEPEQSWDDNTNLDKARRLLAPIKLKYGTGLSWGDLIVLAGNTAIESMGGPVQGFCAGRVDADDGADGLPLGPSAEQEALFPCDAQGSCAEPLGTSTMGLIYVNPEGPGGVPDPAASALQIREVFGRMGMSDRETVALIGGGHAFGKGHGACPAGAGPSPREDPANPWPGACGSGRGADTFTSGFEVLWTPNPTQWDNTFFKLLADYNWTQHAGPAGHAQWRISDAPPELAHISMLTSDVALMYDPAGEYQRYVQEWAKDQASLDEAFAQAWYKLTTRDMGPAARCAGKRAPPAPPFQYPLPAAPAQLADFGAVRTEVTKLISRSRDGDGALLVRLAWTCASTFRATDWRGGCNGARIRHAPERDARGNEGLDSALELLRPVKARFGEGLSWADLIVLAGTAALEAAGGRPLPFCGGRSDAEDGAGSEGLGLRVSGATTDAAQLKEAARLLGLTARELAVLIGGGHSLGQMHAERSGYSGAWTAEPRRLSNDFFLTLLAERWEEVPARGEATQFKARGKELYMMKSDMLLRTDAELAAIAQEYAGDRDLFLDDFAAAWTRIMNADRFQGPVGSVCGEDGSYPLV